MPRQLILALGLLLATASSAWAADAPAHDATANSVASGMTADESTKEPVPNILEFKPSLAISTVIVFFLLLALLGKFAWKPLLASLHQREEHMTHTLAEAERARADAERLLAEHRAQMAQAADQVRGLLDQGRRDAEASSAEILRKAREEADSSRDRAKREIGSARDQALQEVWNRAADLAVSVAGKVLERDLGEDDRRRLVHTALESLPARPPVVNGHGEGASA